MSEADFRRILEKSDEWENGGNLGQALATLQGAAGFVPDNLLPLWLDRIEVLQSKLEKGKLAVASPAKKWVPPPDDPDTGWPCALKPQPPRLDGAAKAEPGSLGPENPT